MATRFYLHAAANGLSGTFPTAIDSTDLLGTLNKKATGADTLRTATTTIGAAQTSTNFSSNASTSTQKVGWAMFCTPAIAAQSIGGGGSSSILVNHANAESNTNMNLDNRAVGTAQVECAIIVWRPSTGALVGKVYAPGLANYGLLGTSEPTSASSEQVSHANNSGTVASVSASDGDVLIIAIGHTFTQGMATSYTGTFYYDGTTANTTENAVVSNHASFVELSQNITFYTPSVVAGGIQHMDEGIGDTGEGSRVPQTLHTIDDGVMA